jgi:hypothetical protein
MQLIPIEDAELEQYRFHHAWKAALRFVKTRMEGLPRAENIDTYKPYVAGYGDGQFACIDIVNDEIRKTEQ